MTTLGLVGMIYFMLLITFSLFNATDLRNAFYAAVEVWLPLLLFNYYKHQIGILVKTLAFAFSVCIYVNLALMLLFPDWIFAADDTFDSFILGGNYNQMGCRFLVGIILNMMCIRYGKKWFVNTIAVIIVAISTLLIVGSMTATSTIVIFVLCCLIPSVRMRKAVAVGYFVFYLLFHIFIVFSGESLHNNELAVYIVEDVLGKDITFTNRTGMWDAALRVIADSPLFGYGMVDREWYLANMSSFAIGPHNFVLSLFIYGGVILFLVFWWMVYVAVRRFQGHIDGFGSILLLSIVSLLFMMSFEVYPAYFIMQLLILAYYYPEIQASSTGDILITDEQNTSETE